jgi:TPR repeat protein
VGRFRFSSVWTAGAVVAVVLAAVIWAVVGELNAPAWVRAIAAGFAAAGTVAGTYLIDNLKSRQGARKDREAVLGNHLRFWQPPAGRLYKMREIDPYTLRITRSKLAQDAAGQDRTPYIPRDKDGDLEQAIRSKMFVLVIGESKAGKSSSAFEAARRARPECSLVVPEERDSLKAVLAVQPPLQLGNSVVWLDDLERYLGSDGEGLSIKMLETLGSVQPAARVLATMRTTEYEKYGSGTRVARTITEVLDRAETIRLRTVLSPQELEAARNSYPHADEHFMLRVRQVGLGPYLLAGPELMRRLENQEGEAGWSIVRVAADWRRAGLTRSLPEDAIKQLYPSYLRPGKEASEAAFTDGLAWARQEIYPSVALLYLDSQGPPRTFRAFDYVVDQIARQAPAVPPETWDLVLKSAAPEEGFAVGVAAAALEVADVAQRAFARAAEEGNSDAANNLGVLLEERGDMNGAENWYRKAAENGAPYAAYNLAVVLAGKGDQVEAEDWYRRAANAGDEDAANNLGVILDERGQSAEAEQWYRKAAQAGQALAAHNLAEVFEDRGDMQEAEQWYRKAADDGESDDAFTLAQILEERGEDTEAEKWLRKAADDSADAMNDLALLLDRKKDGGAAEEAEGLWRKAAEAGQPEANYNLGILLEDTGDLMGAEGWYRRAADLGIDDANDRLETLRARKA